MDDRQPRPTGRHAGRGVAAGGFTICLPGQAAAAVGRWPAGPGRGMLSAWWMKRHDREEAVAAGDARPWCCWRSEEHTSELQSLMRISYAVFCLKKKTKQQNTVYNRAIIADLQR